MLVVWLQVTDDSTRQYMQEISISESEKKMTSVKAWTGTSNSALHNFRPPAYAHHIRGKSRKAKSRHAHKITSPFTLANPSKISSSQSLFYFTTFPFEKNEIDLGSNYKHILTLKHISSCLVWIICTQLCQQLFPSHPSRFFFSPCLSHIKNICC